MSEPRRGSGALQQLYRSGGEVAGSGKTQWRQPVASSQEPFLQVRCKPEEPLASSRGYFLHSRQPHGQTALSPVELHCTALRKGCKLQGPIKLSIVGALRKHASTEEVSDPVAPAIASCYSLAPRSLALCSALRLVSRRGNVSFTSIVGYSSHSAPWFTELFTCGGSKTPLGGFRLDVVQLHKE
ncbi:hypothetical protein EYF80_015592 [Liparis tanakae]|uniref:Uncharacterized protein n=1 Tax=Liparis tanakae TaxID=230148 RepID=A0A4Z2I822_9TELE|nr:hypothetical protein EYF80_015592 [Liparis tanakae]